MSTTIFKNMKQSNKKDKAKNIDIHFYCPRELKAKLDTYVEREKEYGGYSRNDTIRIALIEYLEKVKA